MALFFNGEKGQYFWLSSERVKVAYRDNEKVYEYPIRVTTGFIDASGFSSGSNCVTLSFRNLPLYPATYSIKITWYDHGNFSKTLNGTKPAGSNKISFYHCWHQGGVARLTLTEVPSSYPA